MLRGSGAAIGKARRLRRAMSLPEVLLWRELRKRPGGLRFRRQHPAGPYVLDFACLDARVAVEVDGEGHGFGANPAHDEARDEWLIAQGYRTIRIPAREILSDLGAVVAFILDQCQPLHHAVRGPSATSQGQPLHRPSDGPPPRTGEE